MLAGLYAPCIPYVIVCPTQNMPGQLIPLINELHGMLFFAESELSSLDSLLLNQPFCASWVQFLSPSAEWSRRRRRWSVWGEKSTWSGSARCRACRSKMTSSPTSKKRGRRRCIFIHTFITSYPGWIAAAEWDECFYNCRQSRTHTHTHIKTESNKRESGVPVDGAAGPKGFWSVAAEAKNRQGGPE
jgi:hypothetical protein